jgi:hypothetical protein
MRRDGFSQPFNWCDRVCTRCPLAFTCPTHISSLEEYGFELPYLLDLVDDMACEELPVALRPPPAEGATFTSLRDVKLQQLTHRLSDAVARVFSTPPQGDACEVAEAMLHAATMLGMKAARIGMYLGSVSPDDWIHDSEPNLLLMARLRDQLDEALTTLRPKLDADVIQAIEDSTEAVFEVVDPILTEVSVRARELMASLVSKQEAPSPFCTVGNAGFWG